jgi:hypothetical protein
VRSSETFSDYFEPTAVVVGIISASSENFCRQQKQLQQLENDR